ncbi:chemotaxis protein CheB [Pararhizobium sp. DWP3-4]|uniref:chemotaxis protein CheB n=1 Tax=Pararhizobium sp. DWP3-4 TaxID=2804565 RepID=UPI003CEDC0C6
MKPRIGSGMISPLAAGVLLVLIAVSRTASIRRGAIGVLPSGMLNDGATGLADLKRSGGVTIVPSLAKRCRERNTMQGPAWQAT